MSVGTRDVDRDQGDYSDSLLSLEDTFYEDGKKQGREDGAQAGRIEGRVFGLEKGFEKFFAMGNLAGRQAVWSARMDASTTESGTSTALQSEHQGVTKGEEGPLSKAALSETAIPENLRLRKHLEVLSALTDKASMSFTNEDDAVADFDDRLKRAQGKAKVIERVIGDHEISADSHDATYKRQGQHVANDELNMEDFSVSKRSR